jgi:hypothetical protein
MHMNKYNYIERKKGGFSGYLQLASHEDMMGRKTR